MSGSFLASARRLPPRSTLPPSLSRPAAPTRTAPRPVGARAKPTVVTGAMAQAGQVAVTLLARHAARRGGLLGVALMMLMQHARPQLMRLSWPVVIGVALALLATSALCAAFATAQPKQIVAERRYALQATDAFTSRHPAVRIRRDAQTSVAPAAASSPQTRRRVVSQTPVFVTNWDAQAYRTAVTARDLTLVAGLALPLLALFGGGRQRRDHGGQPVSGPVRPA